MLNLCFVSLFCLYAWLTYPKLEECALVRWNVTHIMICLWFLLFICVLFVSFKIETFKCQHTIFFFYHHKEMWIFLVAHSELVKFSLDSVIKRWKPRWCKLLVLHKSRKTWDLCNNICSNHNVDYHTNTFQQFKNRKKEGIVLLCILFYLHSPISEQTKAWNKGQSIKKQ